MDERTWKPKHAWLSTATIRTLCRHPPTHRYVITKLFSNPQCLRRLSPKTALKVESKKANVFFVRRPALDAGLLREVLDFQKE